MKIKAFQQKKIPPKAQAHGTKQIKNITQHPNVNSFLKQALTDVKFANQKSKILKWTKMKKMSSGTLTQNEERIF